MWNDSCINERGRYNIRHDEVVEEKGPTGTPESGVKDFWEMVNRRCGS